MSKDPTCSMEAVLIFMGMFLLRLLLIEAVTEYGAPLPGSPFHCLINPSEFKELPKTNKDPNL